MPEGDQMLERMQRFPLRKGEMVIWNSGLVHANYPNQSPKMRLVQFIRMLPTDQTAVLKDRYCSARILHQYPEQLDFIKNDIIKVDSLGRKLLSVDTW